MTFTDLLERPSVHTDPAWSEEVWVEVKAPSQVSPQSYFAAAFDGLLAAIEAGERPSVSIDLDALEDSWSSEDDDFDAQAAARIDD